MCNLWPSWLLNITHVTCLSTIPADSVYPVSGRSWVILRDSGNFYWGTDMHFWERGLESRPKSSLSSSPSRVVSFRVVGSGKMLKLPQQRVCGNALPGRFGQETFDWPQSSTPKRKLHRHMLRKRHDEKLTLDTGHISWPDLGNQGINLRNKSTHSTFFFWTSKSSSCSWTSTGQIWHLLKRNPRPVRARKDLLF